MDARGTVDLLRTLVAFDTTPGQSNLPLVNHAAELLEPLGARLRFTFDDTRTKANLLASFGPEAEGGLLLSGHTDTVPVREQVWASDPFALTVHDDRLHGRGAADMKGFIACCLAAAREWASAPLVRPIHLALTYDEEVGCFGVPRLLDDLIAHVPRPTLAIVGEPTLMRLGSRHRGYLGFNTRFIGCAVHSSDPSRGISAIRAAARFVHLLDGMAGPAQGVERTTFNIGLIQGGTHVNIVPGHCDVSWEIRPASDADTTQLQRDAQQLAVQASSGEPPVTRPTIVIPPLSSTSDNALADIARALGAGDETGLPFGTEAGFFQRAGIPAVVCGPGSIEQAHQPDEWIAFEQIEAGLRFARRAAVWASAALPAHTPAA